jgi:hypothetical protein
MDRRKGWRSFKSALAIPLAQRYTSEYPINVSKGNQINQRQRVSRLTRHMMAYYAPAQDSVLLLRWKENAMTTARADLKSIY